MKLLDLFCGAGGMSKGYERAGFIVTGVDLAAQPNYPFEFIQADAIQVMRDESFLGQFDVIHASPPCQAHTRLSSIWKARMGKEAWARKHPDLIPVTRKYLRASGKPYIIENVASKPLINPFMLCGTFFNLKVYRHRFFESNLFFLVPRHIPHHNNCKGVGFVSVTGHFGGFEYAKKAMGINWMERKELSQAIPPAYAQYIGEQIIMLLGK